MKKITSFLMMALCCLGMSAQDIVGSDVPENKLITIGTAQAEMVPGQWYFLHNPRPFNQAATEFADAGGTITSAGGLVTDKGLGNHIHLTESSVIDEVTNPEGVNANNYLANLVRFVEVPDQEGAYNIQFGTGNWLGASPANGTVNHNNYVAGNAGKYNFYLITIDGVPNTAGRFAWNKFDKQDKVDNNGAGNTVVFWASDNGETRNVEAGTLDTDIKSNAVWQIYDIVIVGDVDLYDDALNSLLENYTTITGYEDGMFVDNLREGKNVGDSYGNYRKADVDAFLAIQDTIDLVMETWEFDGPEALMETYPTAADIDSLHSRYVGSYNFMIKNKIPFALNNITPGYYTVNNLLAWFENKSDSVFYTQAEADSINAASGATEGDSVWVAAGSFKEISTSRVPAPIKALCSRDDNGQGKLAWGTLEEKAEYLWKIEAVEGKPTEYRLINMYRGTTFTSIPTSAQVNLVKNDTVTVCFDWKGDSVVAPVSEAKVTALAIRSSSQAADRQFYVHCGGHDGGASKQGFVVGWGATNGTEQLLGSQWYLVPVDEATAQEWMAEGNVAVVLAAKVAKGDSIAAVAPAQFKIAKDETSIVSEADSVVTEASQFFSPQSIIDGTNGAESAPASADETYAFLIDGIQNTYWHTQWSGAPFDNLVHYLQIESPEALEGTYAVKLTRRPVLGNHITKLRVKAYDENNEELTFEDGEDLGTIDLPFTSKNETVISTAFDVTGKTVIRFYCEETVPAVQGEQGNRGFYHASEFNVFKAERVKNVPTTQYEVRKDLIDALQAQIEAWTAKEFSADSLELATDETFEATYNALIAAYDAWTAVYVDPAALRQTIAGAPNENLFVKGDNPGQWKEGVVTPKAVVDAATAYNAAGKYTPAESEAHIAAIEKATEDVFAAANPIETGKWYRIKFPTEEMYDTYGWNKDGAKALIHEETELEYNHALFGKTAAIGKGVTTYEPWVDEEGEEDTLSIYNVEEVDEAFEGNAMYFFEDADFEDGEDLFQFIKATDSTYLLQNKATGLYVRAGHNNLNIVPSYWHVTAIGAGATIIGSTDIFGNKTNPLHGERATNRLVTWNATTLGSNSMMMIEEVEAVTEAPATEFSKKLWPGSTYAFTYPVDVTIKSGATAYSASLAVTEADTTVVLKAITAETITAGTPFVIIADLEGEYKTTADARSELANAHMASTGSYGLNDKKIVNELLDEMYAVVEMDHGTEVDTLVHGMGDLVGTLKGVRVEAGKGLYESNNGFKHLIVDTDVAANKAYIKADFDAESADVLGNIVIKIEGEIESGINEAINKVAQSGNIYTVDGKLVAKGNINTVNNLPAGIYIVNGVKVVKK